MIKWARYLVERWLLRGSWALIVVLVLLLAAIAVAGGVVAYFLPGRHFDSLELAVWWAVLRISDPGYLSDDIPALGVRALSVVLSVLGMSVTVGGIVAIVTQAMNRWLRQLGSASTTVPFRHHVVILGWSDRTPHLLRKLCRKYEGRIVVLLEEVGPSEVRRLARVLPSKADLERVTLRRGTALRRADLERVACDKARSIVIPADADAVSGAPDAGAKVLKTLLVLRAVTVEPRPPVVVELLDREVAEVARSTYSSAHVLQSDRVLARALRLGLQAKGALELSLDLVKADGRLKLGAVDAGDFVGQKLKEVESLLAAGERALGVLEVTQGETTLSMSGEHVLHPENKLLLLRGAPFSQETDARAEGACIHELVSPKVRRILILGWGELVPDLFAELSLEGPGCYEVDIVAEVDAANCAEEFEYLKLRFVRGSPASLGSGALGDLARYQSVLVLADRKLAHEAADVRTIATLLALEGAMVSSGARSLVVAEFLDGEDVEVVGAPDVLVSPSVVADLLASIALAPDSQEDLERTLQFQRLYTSHVMELSNRDVNWPELAAGLRAHSMALLHHYESSPNDVVLVARPVWRKE